MAFVVAHDFMPVLLFQKFNRFDRLQILGLRFSQYHQRLSSPTIVSGTYDCCSDRLEKSAFE